MVQSVWTSQWVGTGQVQLVGPVCTASQICTVMNTLRQTVTIHWSSWSVQQVGLAGQPSPVLQSVDQLIMYKILID